MGDANADLEQAWRPKDIGIYAMDLYFPSTFVSQEALEKEDGVEGKYTIGLGQTNMAFCSACEDINSICLTVTRSLLWKYQIPKTSIGRLEVGTETIIDKSKSVKTVLMSIFDDDEGNDIEGIDTTNACYGGTAALFNAINWMESSSWTTGKNAVVVAGDIAVYAEGPARPTGGCGSISMLIAPNAPIVFEQGLRATHMENVYDFYKPRPDSEYPIVNGLLSVKCYHRAMYKCYMMYKQKYKRKFGEEFNLSKTDYILFHSPYNKLVQKSFAKLMYFDYLGNPKEDSEFWQFKDMTLEEAINSRELENVAMKICKAQYDEKVAPSTLLSKQLGNLYTGSLYGSLLSLICEKGDDLIGKRVLLFSYGSGLASSMFSLRIKGSVNYIKNTVNLHQRLEKRISIPPKKFAEVMKQREEAYAKTTTKGSSVEITASVFAEEISRMEDGTYYINSIDESFIRTYKCKGQTSILTSSSSTSLVDLA